MVVDDGIATGSTARAACQIARAHGAARVVLAVPVAPPGWRTRIGAEADELVCVDTPRGFFAIGEFYARFPQVSDDEVIACLDRAALQDPAQASTARAAGGADPPARSEEVEPHAGVVRLAGYLAVPAGARGIVVFVHGSGSSRHSPRNRYVAGVLNDAGLGTLLFDLLTPGEELDRANVFDIGLLARRLAEVTGWLRAQPRAAQAAVGYFGASTGAAAALRAAAEPGAGIAAVVSRAARPPATTKACGAISLRRYCPDQVLGVAVQLLRCRLLSRSAARPVSPGSSYGPAPSLASQTYLGCTAQMSLPRAGSPAYLDRTSVLHILLRVSAPDWLGTCALRKSETDTGAAAAGVCYGVPPP